MSKHILITGGTGLLGKSLTTALINKGFKVSHLSRKARPDAKVKTFVWNIKAGIIDPDCIAGIDIVLHLAGEGIADKRWTEERKKNLIESRTRSIQLIYSLLKTTPNQVKSVVSASGIGYYSERGDRLMYEDNEPLKDFMGECCLRWEMAVDEGLSLGLRTLKFRTGVVLSKTGGALQKLAMPIKLGVGSALGSGKQWVSWIHLQDVVDMYLMGIENDNITGVYNMVAPHAVTNQTLTEAVAHALHKPLWAPKVPAFVLKLLLGEMCTIVLGSTRVSAEKVEQAGFKFKYPHIEEALAEIYGKI